MQHKGVTVSDSRTEKKYSEKYRLLHGWISLVLMGLVFSVGSIAIVRENRGMFITYLLFSAAGATGVLYAFCAKCSCRDACRHVFPGSLSRLLPRRETAPYTFKDLAMTVVGIAPIVLFPQFWLFGQKRLLLLFWQLSAALVAEILLFVCRGCTNRYCPACRMRKRDYYSGN